jgi:hypothetical protein
MAQGVSFSARRPRVAALRRLVYSELVRLETEGRELFGAQASALMSAVPRSTKEAWPSV